jgi:hypothetical protein
LGEELMRMFWLLGALGLVSGPAMAADRLMSDADLLFFCEGTALQQLAVCDG